MTKASQRSTAAARRRLFEQLRAAKSGVVMTTARDTGIEPRYIEPAFEQVLDLVAEPQPTEGQIGAWRKEGVRLAREGAPAERVLDGYLSLNWAIWEVVMTVPGMPRDIVLDFADRLLRGMDDAIAAISEGYVRVEVELAAAHSHERRAVLEEVLSAPRATPEDRTRIRRRAERHGLAPAGSYRLILVAVRGLEDDAVEDAVDALERRVRVPVPHHRTRPGIRLPVVLEWRGRILVFATADWSGEGRLREALSKVTGDGFVAVDSGPIEGCEALADGLAQLDYAIGVAIDLGQAGWVGDPGGLALETTFLLDDELVGAAVERELGPVLADRRMGPELLETLEVYLGARQNTRETARRLHLAPRTVAYRLERIETLLGRSLDGEAIVRISAALLALRVSRQAGRLGKSG